VATEVIGTRQLRDELAATLERLADVEELIVTQRGEGKAVLIDIERYRQLTDRLEYLEDTLDALEGERAGAVPIGDLI
jgi:prevent-host-death family protein